MLQTSLLLTKSLNKTETPIFLIRSVFFVSKGNLFDVYWSTALKELTILKFLVYKVRIVWEIKFILRIQTITRYKRI